jgi:hypothetical protein
MAQAYLKMGMKPDDSPKEVIVTLAKLPDAESVALAKALIAVCDAQDIEPGDGELDIKTVVRVMIPVFGFRVKITEGIRSRLFVEDIV